jgi:glycosyltransferase involved in cell wall biosynthesis
LTPDRATAPPAAEGTVAVLSTFPPAVCGVGIYAEQQVQRMAEQGQAVQRLDLGPLQAHGWRMGKGSAVARLLGDARRAGRIVFHHQIWMYRDDTRRSRALAHLGPLLVILWLLLRNGRRTEMVVHEWRYKLFEGPFAWLQYPYSWLLYRLPRTLTFHTRTEMQEFRRRFGRRRGLQLKAHGSDFKPFATTDRSEARRRLGLPGQETLFLCIGFYKVHKGFRSLAATFTRLRAAGALPPEARLRIVTSMQDGRDAAAAEDLARLRAESPPAGPVVLHEGFVSDEEFDLWLAAADVVALPYKAIFSSSVAARANTVGRRLLVTDVGGLPEQAGPAGRVYRSEAELEAALAELARDSRASP